MKLGRTTDSGEQAAIEAPFRMVIDGASLTPQGPMVSGKVETGTLHPGEPVEISGRLGRCQAGVKAIEHFNARIDEASPGLYVGVVLDGLAADELKTHVDKGDYLCAARYHTSPVAVSRPYVAHS